MLSSITRTAVAIRPAASLDATTTDRMWALYEPHHHTDRPEFDQRLATLDDVALFTRRHDQALIGFCGLRHRAITTANGERVATFYMGLSYVEPAWRSNALPQRMVVKRVLRPLLSPRFRRVYFWTDCLTYRPYLAMARNLPEFYPSRTHVVPDEVRDVVSTLGRTYYSDNFDADAWTVRKDTRRIKAHEAHISAADLGDPDIAYYLARNRGYDRGDGLIAICPMGVKNLLALVARQLSKRHTPVGPPSRPQHAEELAAAGV